MRCCVFGLGPKEKMKRTLEDCLGVLTQEELEAFSKLNPKTIGNRVEVERGLDLLVKKGYLETLGKDQDGNTIYRLREEFQESWLEYFGRLTCDGWAQLCQKIEIFYLKTLIQVVETWYWIKSLFD
jgi:hypothetical protein